MRFANGFYLVHPTNSRRRWLIAAWHPSWSITWLWLIDFSVYLPRTFKPHFYLTPSRHFPVLGLGLGGLAHFHWSKHNSGGMSSVGLLGLSLHYSWQRAMVR